MNRRQKKKVLKREYPGHWAWSRPGHIRKEACSRNLFEPCDSKLLHWFNEKPRTP